MSDNWKLLDWHVISPQVPALLTVRADAPPGDINGHVHRVMQEWWNALPIQRKRELLGQRLCQLQQIVVKLVQAEEIYTDVPKPGRLALELPEVAAEVHTI